MAKYNSTPMAPRAQRASSPSTPFPRDECRLRSRIALAHLLQEVGAHTRSEIADEPDQHAPVPRGAVVPDRHRLGHPCSARRLLQRDALANLHVRADAGTDEVGVEQLEQPAFLDF